MLVSENPFAVNVLTSPKNSWNLRKSTFVQLFHHSLPNWVTKSYFIADVRFYNCLLTRWMPTASILVLIERIYRAKLSHKKLFYIRSEILELLVNTLNASCEYFRSNREILPLLIQIKLSKNWYVFYCIFVALLESTLSFQCS